MSICLRCDWQPDPAKPDPKAQARGHALDTEHPLCGSCGRSLDSAHPQTCEECIRQAQADLAGVLLMWTELPDQLGHAAAAPPDRDGRGGSEEFALPGGTILALLAPGSAGGQPSARGNREHLADNAGDSVPSVAWVLASWEDDWASARADPPPPPGRRVSVVVCDAAAYLAAHTRWAGNTHPAFGEYADEIRQLHGRLEVATGRVRRPVKAGASCFECDGTLERPLHEVTAQGRTGLVEVEDLVECRQCGSTYDGARYLLALAARRQEALDGWVAVPAAALASRRPVRTLRAWLGVDVPVACDVRSRAQVLWYPALADRASSAQRRAKTSA